MPQNCNMNGQFDLEAKLPSVRRRPVSQSQCYIMKLRTIMTICWFLHLFFFFRVSLGFFSAEGLNNTPYKMQFITGKN